MTRVVKFFTNRSEYGIKEAAEQSMTISELINYLQNEFVGDEKIVFSNDRGYTYGYVNENYISEPDDFDEVED